MKDTLGDRIKAYERVSASKLLPNVPVIVRIDGRSFHTFTRGLDKPFSNLIVKTMVLAAHDTARQMSGFKLGYVQSDEATFMLTDYDTYETQSWFDYEINKLVSISASAFTAFFNKHWDAQFSPNINDDNYKPDFIRQKPPAMFDSRAFNVPAWDVPNVFIWRQRDWERNSVQMLARAYISHKDCQGKNVDDLKAMLIERHDMNWDNIHPQMKYGTWLFRDGSVGFHKRSYEDLQEMLNGTA